MKENKSVLLATRTYLDNEGDTLKAIRELKKLIKKGRDTGDQVLIGDAYFWIGACCYDIGDRKGIALNAYKSAAFLRDTEEYHELAKAYILLSYAYGEMENYQSELAVLEKVDKLAGRHRLKANIRRTCLNNTATCHHRLGDFKTAIRLQKECIALHRKFDPDDLSRMLMYTNNLAEFQCDNGEPEQARETLGTVEDILGKVENKVYICDYYLRSAIICFMLNDTKKANTCIDRAFTHFGEGEFLYQIYNDLRIVSGILTDRKDWKRAGRILEMMKTYAAERTDTIDQITAYRTMSEYYARKGEDRLAIECYVKLEELNERHREELNREQLGIHKMIVSAEKETQMLSRKLSQVEELAYLDPLSGLLNRAALLRVSSDFIETAAKKKEKVGAIFIDIDFFKQCNDTYGHAKGDEIIREVADACKKENRQNVSFARYGGDEFFGITRGLDDEEVMAIAQRICQRIRKADIPNDQNPNGHRVTLSVGAVNVPITGHTDTIIEIANYADNAVYYSKNAGKNAIYFLDHERKEAKYLKVDF